MNKRKKWTTLRKNISKLLNISPDVLDFLSNYDIMLESVSGISNKDISEHLDIREDEIRKVLFDNIGSQCNGWKGYKESGVINPYFIYKSLIKSLGRVPTEEDFAEEMQKLTGDILFLGEDFSTVYNIVSIFSTLRFRYLAKYRKEDYGNYLNRNSKETTRLR